jgi:1-phosphofructokinase
MTMILTVTPNPSLDLTYRLPGGFPGGLPGGLPGGGLPAGVEVHRASSATLEASGKGVNVSRSLRSIGRDTVALLFSGGATGRQLLELLAGEKVAYRAIEQSGPTRVNTTILVDGSPTLKVNAPGPVMTQASYDNLVWTLHHELLTHGRGQGWVVLCGSLPPLEVGAPLKASHVVHTLVETAHAHDWKVAVDSSGEALVAAAVAGADLLTPNAAELTALLDPVADSESRDEAGTWAGGAGAAEVARAHGCELLVSRGGEGALWTDGERIVHAVGPVVVPVNTAGAGDALLAGWFAHEDLAVADRLATAVRWGAAACLAATTVRIPAEPLDSTRSDVVVHEERAYPTAAPS